MEKDTNQSSETPTKRVTLDLNDEYLGTADAAKILNRHQGSVARLLRKGDLQGEKFGADWVITRAAVEKYRESSENPSPRAT